MNLTMFRLRVQRTLGLASNTTGDEQTLVDSWVNEAVEQFLLKTKVKKKTAALSLTAGQGDYVLDASILAFEDVHYNALSQTDDYGLEQVDSEEIRRMRRVQASVEGPPGYFAYEGQSIMLYPIPASSSDKLHMVYVERPTSAIAAGSDSPSDTGRGEIPLEYHPILEEYVLWKAARYSDHAPSQFGELFRVAWERGLVEARITESRKAGVRVGYARLGRGVRRHIRRPGVDTGF